jgi:uncharacterized protein
LAAQTLEASAQEVITLDTSAIFALANRRDPQHKLVRSAFLADAGPHLIPSGIMAEVGYLLETRLGIGAILRFLDTLMQDLMLDCGEKDLQRVQQLVERYDDLPLGLADAIVIACAERHGGAVLTLDEDFTVVAREGKLRVLPA